MPAFAIRPPTPPTAPALDDGPYGYRPGDVATTPRPTPYGGPPAMTNAGGGYVPGTDPTYDAQLAQQVAQRRSLDARRNVNAASAATTEAQFDVLPMRYGSLQSRRRILDAQTGTFGPQREVFRANRDVNAATGRYNEGERNLITLNMGENDIQRSEFQREQDALNNVIDIGEVAKYKRQTAASDAQRRQWGITPDIEVQTPVGFTGALPVGVRAAATTQAEDVARTNATSQKLRGFDMEAARLAVSLLGNDRARAQQVAADAGMTLQEAQQAVREAEVASGYASNAEDVAGLGVDVARLRESQARNAADDAALDVTGAGLDLSESRLPPFPGAVHPVDPATGLSQPTWVTPAEADAAETQYELNRTQGRTQIQSGGSPIASISTNDLLNQYGVALYRQGDPRFISNTAIENEIVRRLIAQGYNEEQAKREMQSLITLEQERRRKQQQGRPTAAAPTD